MTWPFTVILPTSRSQNFCLGICCGTAVCAGPSCFVVGEVFVVCAAKDGATAIIETRNDKTTNIVITIISFFIGPLSFSHCIHLLFIFFQCLLRYVFWRNFIRD